MKLRKPKYLQIYDEIRTSLANQTWQPGDYLPTEEALCKTYQASRPTIAKALHLLVKENLVQRRAGAGTKVLAPKRSGLSAGFLIPRLHQTEIFEPICRSLSETAGMEAMRILRPAEINQEQDPARSAEHLAEYFIKAKVRGVFFTPVERIADQENFNMDIIKRLTRHNIRVVLLDRDVFPWPKQTPYDLVGIDNIQAGYVTAMHLLGNGCQQLAFVSAANPAMTVQLRRIGCREALLHKERPAADLVSVAYHPEAPQITAKKLLELNVAGVICANDATAAPLLRALVDIGADIPHQLQVCGFDDVKYAALLSVPLTSYHQPVKDIGKTAARVMLNRLRYPNAPATRVTLRGELVIRDSSCGPVSTNIRRRR